MHNSYHHGGPACCRKNPHLPEFSAGFQLVLPTSAKRADLPLIQYAVVVSVAHARNYLLAGQHGLINCLTLLRFYVDGKNRMGLYLMLGQPDEWELKYNCTFYSVDLIPVEQRRNPMLAGVFLILFVTNEVLYAPCLYAMLQKKLRTVFCYKLMIEMAVFDMTGLMVTSLLPSYYSVEGMVYCSTPKFNYINGCFVFAVWEGYSSTTLILAVNRCLAISDRHHKLFKGKWTQRFWLSIPPTVALVVLMTGQSSGFNPQLGGYFYNPHIGYFDDQQKYTSTLLTVNNFFFSLGLPAIYGIFFWRHRELMGSSRGHSKREVQLFIQTFIINGTIALSAAGYILMQYLPVPPLFVAVAHVAWIMVEGAPPIVYLTMNRQIRRILFSRLANTVSSSPPVSAALTSKFGDSSRPRSANTSQSKN